jgi:hypothetical protein
MRPGTLVQRRLFLAVPNLDEATDALPEGLFVRTRLPFAVGEPLLLGLSAVGHDVVVDVPVVVVRRRLPRTTQQFSAGVVVRAVVDQPTSRRPRTGDLSSADGQPVG